MNLSELYLYRNSINKNQTDKGRDHNYIDGYYNQKFAPSQHANINLLELGVARGESLSLWREFFSKASIYGIDIDKNVCIMCNTISNIDFRVENGYCQKALDMFKDGFFDFIIEDGPHSLETQIFAAKEWTKKLKIEGVLIIEDIQNYDFIPTIRAEVPQNCQVNVYDLRKDKNRYDDIIVEITRKS